MAAMRCLQQAALAAVLGLGAASLAAAQSAAPAAATPGWVHKTTHGNWDVICAKAADAKESCQATQVLETRDPKQGQQQAQAPKEGQRVLRLIAQKGADGTVFSFELPFGLDLRPGIVYQIDGGAEATLPFLTCMPGGCLASMVLKDEDKRRLVAGKQMKVGFRPLGSEKIVVVEVGLNGLDKALTTL